VIEDRALHEAEARVPRELAEVLEAPVREIVDGGDLVTSAQQPLRQIRADEAGGPRDGDPQCVPSRVAGL
jgi:hypothetical protein